MVALHSRLCATQVSGCTALTGCYLAPRLSFWSSTTSTLPLRLCCVSNFVAVHLVRQSTAWRWPEETAEQLWHGITAHSAHPSGLICLHTGPALRCVAREHAASGMRLTELALAAAESSCMMICLTVSSSCWSLGAPKPCGSCASGKTHADLAGIEPTCSHTLTSAVYPGLRCRRAAAAAAACVLFIRCWQ